MFPSLGSYPMDVILPWAGAWTGVFGAAPISNPSCQAGFSVKGEILGPNPDVTHPFTGQIEGVEAQRDERCSAACDNSSRMRSCIVACFESRSKLSLTDTIVWRLSLDDSRATAEECSWLPSDICREVPDEGFGSFSLGIVPPSSGIGTSSPPLPFAISPVLGTSIPNMTRSL